MSTDIPLVVIGFFLTFTFIAGIYLVFSNEMYIAKNFGVSFNTIAGIPIDGILGIVFFVSFFYGSSSLSADQINLYKTISIISIPYLLLIICLQKISDQNEKKSDSSADRNLAWLLFSLQGRITRGTFWFFNLFWIFVGLGIQSINKGLPIKDWGAEFSKTPGEAITSIVWLFCFLGWPSLAILIKRLQDTNRSGWWVLVNFIPLGQIYIFLVCAFESGTKGSNQFGPDPSNEY
jgi:uncharacterized membrane protein YhaH (DUF805 family)